MHCFKVQRNISHLDYMQIYCHRTSINKFTRIEIVYKVLTYHNEIIRSQSLKDTGKMPQCLEINSHNFNHVGQKMNYTQKSREYFEQILSSQKLALCGVIGNSKGHEA